jgi:hypothetical protein
MDGALPAPPRTPYFAPGADILLHRSKEDVVLSRHDDFERALLQAIRTAPPAEPILRVAEQAAITALSSFDVDEARLMEQLKRDEPALRLRDHGKYERLERAIAEALAQRLGTAPDDLRTRLDAMIVAGVLRVGGEGWLRASAAGVPIADYVRQVVATLGGSLPAADPA